MSNLTDLAQYDDMDYENKEASVTGVRVAEGLDLSTAKRARGDTDVSDAISLNEQYANWLNNQCMSWQQEQLSRGNQITDTQSFICIVHANYNQGASQLTWEQLYMMEPTVDTKLRELFAQGLLMGSWPWWDQLIYFIRLLYNNVSMSQALADYDYVGVKRYRKLYGRRGKRARYYVNSRRGALRNVFGKEFFSKDANNDQKAQRLKMFGASWQNCTEDQKKNRLRYRYYGSGDYRSFIRGVGRWGSRIGGAIVGGVGGFESGGLVGAIGGAYQGYQAGADYSKQMGWGDYGMMNTNQIIDQGPVSMNANKNIMVNATDLSGDIYMSHTEFIGNVTAIASGAGSSPFQVTSYKINPGLEESFPFLSQIAQNFVLYDLQGLIYHFKPTSGEASSASNSLGKVIMATQYDVDAPDFTNSIQMANYDYAQTSKPSIGMMHGVETANNQQHGNMMYIRTGTVSKSLVFCDLGTFQIATEGIPFSAAGEQILGELWVTYRVKLSRANLHNTLSNRAAEQDVIYGECRAASLWSSANYKSTNQLGFTTAVSATVATRMTLNLPSGIERGCWIVTVEFYDAANFGGTQVCDLLSPSSTGVLFFLPGEVLPQNTPVHWSSPEVGVAANTRIGLTFGLKLVDNWTKVSQSCLIVVSAALKDTSTYRIVITEFNEDAANTLL